MITVLASAVQDACEQSSFAGGRAARHGRRRAVFAVLRFTAPRSCVVIDVNTEVTAGRACIMHAHVAMTGYF